MALGGTGTDARAPAPDRHWLNEERIRVYSWMILAAFAAGFVIWIGLSLPDLVDPGGQPLGHDFMSFWSAARLALGGRPEAAYDWTATIAIGHAAVPAVPQFLMPWRYPPAFLLVVLPFGLLPYPAALAAFLLCTASLWAVLVRRVFPDPRAWIVAAATPAGLIAILPGQNGFLTASLAGFALTWLDRRPITAGVLIGLLSVKPQLGVLFPLALLAEARWRAMAAAGATAMALNGASLAIFGWRTFAAFVEHLSATGLLIDRLPVAWGQIPTPYVFALSLGLPTAMATALQGAAALFAALCVWRAWRNRTAAFEAKAATLVAGALLITPHLSNYDLTWAALAVGWLAVLGLRTGFRRGEREILLFAWLAPLLMQPVYALTSAQLVGFPALLLLLLAAVRRAAPLDDGERRRLRRAIDALRAARWVTRERLRRWGVGFAVMSLTLLAVHVVTHTTAGLTNGNGDELANDFIVFRSGAQLAAGGQAGLAYDNQQFHAFTQAVTGPSSHFRPYVYPPIAMLLSLPLVLFPFIPALIVWTLAGTGLCIALLRRLIGWRSAALAAVGAPAAYFDLLSGQNGHFTASLFAGGLMVLDRRPIVAGICFGCLAYKPQTAVLLPFALIAGGRWRAFAAAGVTVTLLGLASLGLCGEAAWTGFFAQADLRMHLHEFDSADWHRMPTVFVALRVIGAALPVAYAAQLVSGALALLAVVLVWRSPGPFETKAATVAVASFLATPYAWDYDAVVLIFAAAWLGREGLRTGFLAWERIAIVALLVSPLLTMVTTKLADAQFGPVVLWLVLVLLLRRSLGYQRSAPAAGLPGAIGRPDHSRSFTVSSRTTRAR